MDHDEVIAILDFGSQYAQLIARRVREAGVFSELVRPDVSLEELRARENVKGIILSGGPSSVYDPGAPKADERISRRACRSSGSATACSSAPTCSAGASSPPPRASSAAPSSRSPATTRSCAACPTAPP